jgi:CubicO group peptidase (beta-lactamase class C family)
VTLRHLLTHTDGFGYGTWHEPIKRFAKATKIPSRPTGKRAALMVEAASGHKLGDYLAANILGPLGLNSTGFRVTDDMGG